MRLCTCGLALAVITAPSRAHAAPSAQEPKATAEPAAAPAEPPRLDGPYVGALTYSALGLARVNDLDTDGAFAGFGGAVQAGQFVLPWLGLGLSLGGAFAVRSETGARQTLGQGALLVDFTFVPGAKKRIPLSLKASFGFGGGAIRQVRRSGRSGYGGALFAAAIRYEFFPGIKRYRPDRGGGFGLGPELGWIGATPPAPGRPTAHLFYLGLAMTFYFGS